MKDKTYVLGFPFRLGHMRTKQRNRGEKKTVTGTVWSMQAEPLGLQYVSYANILEQDIVSILQMSKLRLRKVKRCVQGLHG